MIRLLRSARTASPPGLGGGAADELADVARLAARGDRSATNALLVALAPHLLRSVRAVLGSADPEVEDVAQEAALTVLSALPSFRGESTVLRFATRTAVLVAMNARRRRSARKRGGAERCIDAEPDELDAGAEGPEARLVRARAAQAVRRLLSMLPQAQAEALALHCIAGCTLAEIAQATGAPVETVKSRLRLARHALRSALDRSPELLSELEEHS